MPGQTLSGNDTAVIDNHIFNDLADANVVEVNFPNDIAAVKTGKNGNALFSLNETGKQCEVIIRTLRGGSDDKFLLAKLNAQNNDFASTVLMQGQFVKKLGDGKGNLSYDNYDLSGGVIGKGVPGKDNVEGDTDQNVAVYNLKFSKGTRQLT